MKNNLLLLFFILFSSTVFGQRAKEVGIRFRDVNNFNVIYKTGKNADHLLRIRSVMGNVIQSNYSNGESSTAFDFGAAVGKENHVPLGDRVDFIHGLEGGLHFTILGRATTNTNVIQLNGGYLLGGVYELSDHFNVGAEIIPGVYYTTATGSGIDQNVFGVSFNTNSAALTLTYAFTK